ncbi:hypothetical protein HYQ46_011873 [Verticillium longisporum]|nr:hypothetical protein HYQ46_011873 [Verticillium longisporum]
MRRRRLVHFHDMRRRALESHRADLDFTDSCRSDGCARTDDGVPTLHASRATSQAPNFHIVKPPDVWYPSSTTVKPNAISWDLQKQHKRWLAGTHPEAFTGMSDLLSDLMWSEGKPELLAVVDDFGYWYVWEMQGRFKVTRPGLEPDLRFHGHIEQGIFDVTPTQTEMTMLAATHGILWIGTSGTDNAQRLDP